MPLKIEAFRDGEWGTVNQMKPGDRPGTLSHNRLDGIRDLYFFECAPDGSKSVLSCSKGGADAALGLTDRVAVIAGLEIIKELTEGESHELIVQTDISSQKRRVRFSHI